MHSRCPASSFTIRRGLPQEVTKNQYFNVTLDVVGCNCQERSVNAELLYEDGVPVPPAVGHQVLEGKSVWSSINEVILSVRINELSHSHRNRRFLVRVSHAGLCAETHPLKVMSKSSIVKAHLSGSAATTASAVGTAKRRRNETEEMESRGAGRSVQVHLADEVLELRAMQERLERRAEEAAALMKHETQLLHTDVAALGACMSALLEQISRLTSPCQSAVLHTPATVLPGFAENVGMDAEMSCTLSGFDIS